MRTVLRSKEGGGANRGLNLVSHRAGGKMSLLIKPRGETGMQFDVQNGKETRSCRQTSNFCSGVLITWKIVIAIVTSQQPPEGLKEGGVGVLAFGWVWYHQAYFKTKFNNLINPFPTTAQIEMKKTKKQGELWAEWSRMEVVIVMNFTMEKEVECD